MYFGCRLALGDCRGPYFLLYWDVSNNHSTVMNSVRITPAHGSPYHTVCAVYAVCAVVQSACSSAQPAQQLSSSVLLYTVLLYTTCTASLHILHSQSSAQLSQLSQLNALLSTLAVS